MTSYQIERLSIQADGVAHDSDHSTIYAPMTLPGEEITGDLREGRIAQPKILTPSISRVRPPCPHYKTCGGCALQHGSDAFVAQWKTQVIESALASRDVSARVTRIETSPPRSRRRATLSGRRTKKSALVGFHGRASGIMTEIPNCTLLRPELVAAIPALRDLTVIGATRKGEIAFAMTLSEAGVEVAATGGKEMTPELFAQISATAETHDLARISWNRETVAARRLAYQAMGAAKVTPPPGAFLQATTEGAAVLVDFAQHWTSGAAKIVDLFAGCGTFTLPLAATAEMHAVEAEAPMLEAMDQGWRQAQGLKRISHEARDLYRRPLLPDELNRYDAIVMDPPRNGAEAQTAEICNANVKRLVYVSCNPVSFARDAAQLIAAGFVLRDLIAVDQFRWSSHCELAAAFTRE
ncbi:RNA methyltransferase [Thioclava sp. SK-1]|uniref:class I SAM-dependent RNA methyltransferase n=1 Tax=Thioclava sp. SK-1 TaxID=1889770 RepID=UPI000825B87F|nr:class I SAM-dependent RNA methyltransferase [Thioclava sp. SK-1]OCX61668.1 RNA methyltransferase [Thioclava sp. SK-1]